MDSLSLSVSGKSPAEGSLHPHSHPTHEFYYIISERGIMKIADEEREVGQGDLIRIPPDVVHSVWPLTATTRGSAGWRSPSGSKERVQSTTQADTRLRVRRRC